MTVSKSSNANLWQALSANLDHESSLGTELQEVSKRLVGHPHTVSSLTEDKLCCLEPETQIWL